MKHFHRSLLTLATGTLLASAAAQASTVNITKDLSNPSSIPGLTTFATTGAMMSGLSITATFSGGLSQTALWGTTGATSGGAFGSGWSLSVTGDTFAAPWQFVFSPNASLGQLVSMVIDGSNALTVLDTAEPSPGTDDSAQGADFGLISGCDNCTADVTYDSVVGIGAAGPVNDLFQRVTINFGTSGPRADWSFRQDTDNDSRFGTVPEPGGVALVSLALGALVATRRRRVV